MTVVSDIRHNAHRQGLLYGTPRLRKPDMAMPALPAVPVVCAVCAVCNWPAMTAVPVVCGCLLCALLSGTSRLRKPNSAMPALPAVPALCTAVWHFLLARSPIRLVSLHSTKQYAETHTRYFVVSWDVRFANHKYLFACQGWPVDGG